MGCCSSQPSGQAPSGRRAFPAPLPPPMQDNVSHFYFTAAVHRPVPVPAEANASQDMAPTTYYFHESLTTANQCCFGGGGGGSSHLLWRLSTFNVNACDPVWRTTN